MEFITADDSFAYVYCPYAMSPQVMVVYQYDLRAGVYLPNCPAFANQYTPLITQNEQKAVQLSRADSIDGWDQARRCAVLPQVLDYPYSGQTDAAWKALAQYYPFDDRIQFQEETWKTVSLSPYYRQP
jgi:hypothetical protein